MATILSVMFGFNWLNYAGVPFLLLQCSLLHPYYESDSSARLIRLILLPIIVTLAVSSQSRRLFIPLEDYLHLNYAVIAIPTFHVCCLAVQFALHRGACLKPAPKPKLAQESEKVGQEVCSKVHQDQHDHSPSEGSPDSELVPQSEDSVKSKAGDRKEKADSPSVMELTKFSLAMLTSPRGLEYTWAPPPSCLSRAPKKPIREFFIETLLSVAKQHIHLVMASAYLLPATNHAGGPPGWMAEAFNLPQSRPLELFANHLTAAMYGFAGISAFTMCGALAALAELAYATCAPIFLPTELCPKPFDTTLYPPLFNKPGSRDNLSDFWGKAWQCVFRRDFVFCGGYPMTKIGAYFGKNAAKLFGVMGALAFSGIFHEWGLLTITKPDWNFNTTKFFIVQGIGIILEQIFRLMTNQKVGGWMGFIWTYSWLSFSSQPMLQTWFERGLGKSGIVEPDFRKWSWIQFLVPFGPFLPQQSIDWISSVSI